MRLAAIALIACSAAIAADDTPTLRDAQNPALSVYTGQEDMVVWVSPVRQTMQLAGSYGAVIGTVVSAAVDSVYQRRVNEALAGYDERQLFEDRLRARLTETLGKAPAAVKHLRSTAGYNNVREAADARYAGMARSGYDMALDSELGWGIYGSEGMMVLTLDARLTETGKPRTLHRGAVWVSSAPMLADEPLGNPTDRLTPNITRPRFKVAEDAMDQWVANGGAELKARFESAVEAAVSAALVDLELSEEAAGAYHLGRQAYFSKKFKDAERRFEQALAWQPGLTDASNGLALVLARTKRLDEAIARTLEIAAANPEYAPAHYNLAYWLAVKKDDAAAAEPHYKRALELGMTGDRDIEKKLERLHKAKK